MSRYADVSPLNAIENGAVLVSNVTAASRAGTTALAMMSGAMTIAGTCVRFDAQGKYVDVSQAPASGSLRLRSLTRSVSCKSSASAARQHIKIANDPETYPPDG